MDEGIPRQLIRLARIAADQYEMTLRERDGFLREVFRLAGDLAMDLQLSDEALEELLFLQEVEDDK